jgi:hypothetical protein
MNDIYVLHGETRTTLKYNGTQTCAGVVTRVSLCAEELSLFYRFGKIPEELEAKLHKFWSQIDVRGTTHSSTIHSDLMRDVYRVRIPSTHRVFISNHTESKTSV